MKKFIFLLILIFALTSCNSNGSNNNANDNNSTNDNLNTDNDENKDDNTNNDQGSNDINTSTNGVITYNFDTFAVSSLLKNACSKSGQTITFTKAGEYTLTGTFTGSLVFKVDTMESVTLYLNNAKINSVDNHAIYWMNDTGKIEIKAMENTTNEIVMNNHSTNLYSAIESENNIEIGGSGKLTIKGLQRHAVKGSNIEVKGNVDLTIEADKDGLHGKHILISGGNTKINNCTDAIQAEINSNNLKGTIIVEEGTLTITNCKRAFRAMTSVTIEQLSGCTLKIDVTNVEELFDCPKVNYVNGTFLVNGNSYK